jgi:rhamnogalacturonyl hydrolase YesR
MRSVKYVSALAVGFMALSGFAEPVYKSSFKNKGKSDAPISDFSWHSMVAYADGSVRPAGLPAVGVQAADYAFYAPRLNKQLSPMGPGLIWTEVLNVQLDVLKQLQVSVKADGSGNEPAKARVAIQAGGQWFVSNWQYSTNVENKDFKPVSLELDDWADGANWRKLTGIPGSLQVADTVVAGKISGTVSGLGLFVETGNRGDHFRFKSLKLTDASDQPFVYHDDPIIAAMQRAKNFQEQQRDGHLPFNWKTGTFYSGVFACYQATGEEEFLTAAREWCASADWTITEKIRQNADVICSAQTFINIYSVDRDPKQIAHIDEIFHQYYFGQETVTKSLMGHAIWRESSRPMTGRNLWWWCDALYMAPPVLAGLGQATGNPQYYELLHRLYWDAVEYLYRPEERLFLRDKDYFTKQTPGGKPVFWGRGNGWVIGGLVRTIDCLPESDPMRPKYIKLFQDMMSRIVTLQGDDGMWRSSLNEPSWYPMKESSGSSFFTFGLAAGINRGWLDRATYLPAMEKGWAGLLNCLSPEGKVRWAQAVAGWPGPVKEEDTSSYTQGAFLLAAAEVYKLEHQKSYDPSVPRTWCRYVPERIDDFAWENDKIAFRTYGPKARDGAENSGIDCWLKRVDYPIVDKWYGQMKTKSYHKDWGEGHDPYHVGSSAGCGGTGIWLNGNREPLETYIRHEVIERSPERSQFKLTYKREIGGDVYGEEKTVVIELGERLFHVRSVFTKNGKIASGLPVCIGLTTHDGAAEPFWNEQQGWIACWEKINDSELGTAVMSDPKRIDEIKEVKSSEKDDSHLLILARTDRFGAIEYQAGYGWQKAGEINTSNDWKNYLTKESN